MKLVVVTLGSRKDDTPHHSNPAADVWQVPSLFRWPQFSLRDENWV